MIEMMITGSKAKAVIPSDTGPGGKDLLFQYARNSTQLAGYFGRVPASSLITGTDLSTLGGVVGGTDINAEKGWLKFLCDGKILFVAQACYKQNIRPSGIGAAMTGKQVTIGEHVYTLRSIRGTVIDNDPNKTVIGSEWNRLIHSVLANSAESQVEVENGVKWDNLSSADIGLDSNIASQTICWETSYYTSNPGNYRITRGTSYGSYSAISQLYNQTAETRSGWRPVLELIGPAT